MSRRSPTSELHRLSMRRHRKTLSAPLARLAPIVTAGAPLLPIATALPEAAGAQGRADVRPGDRVRLDVPSLDVRRLTGTVTATTPDTIRCDDNASNDDCGPKAEYVLQAGIIGAAIGGVLRAVVGLVRPSEQWDTIHPPIRLAAGPDGRGGWALAIALRR